MQKGGLARVRAQNMEFADPAAGDSGAQEHRAKSREDGCHQAGGGTNPGGPAVG